MSNPLASPNQVLNPPNPLYLYLESRYILWYKRFHLNFVPLNLTNSKGFYWEWQFFAILTSTFRKYYFVRISKAFVGENINSFKPSIYFFVLSSYFRDNDDRLAKVNAVFRTIDLATLSLAPLSAGLVFDFISNSAAAYFIAAWNMTSMIFEYWLLKSIYKEFPMLAHKTIFENPESNDERKTSFLTKVTIEAFRLSMQGLLTFFFINMQ